MLTCKQRQIDRNPNSSSFGEERVIVVPCPPHTPCTEIICSITASVGLSLLGGKVKITISVTPSTGLNLDKVYYSLNGSTFQKSNIFFVQALPTQGYTVIVFDEHNNCTKQINTGYINNPGRYSESVFLRTYIKGLYCPNTTQVFAQQTIDVFEFEGKEFESIRDTTIIGIC